MRHVGPAAVGTVVCGILERQLVMVIRFLVVVVDGRNGSTVKFNGTISVFFSRSHASSLVVHELLFTKENGQK